MRWLARCVLWQRWLPWKLRLRIIVKLYKFADGER